MSKRGPVTVATLSLTLVLVFSACSGSTIEGGGGQGGTGGTGGSGGEAGQGGTGGGMGGTAGTSGQAGVGGVGGTGGVIEQPGDCSDTDPNRMCQGYGETCVELVPDGFTVCAMEIEEATVCASGMDECCDSSDCAQGSCFPNPVVPFCGGAYPAQMNVCASDFCQQDSDCHGSDQVCAARSVNGNAVRYCMPKYCTTDADCDAKAGGICAPVQEPCCPSWAGLFCVYPDGCRIYEDCGPGRHCMLNWEEGTGECRDGPLACPG